MENFRYHVHCLRAAHRRLVDESSQIEAVELLKTLVREMGSTLLRRQLEHNLSRTVTQEAQWLIQETYGSEWAPGLSDAELASSSTPSRSFESPYWSGRRDGYDDLISAFYEGVPLGGSEHGSEGAHALLSSTVRECEVDSLVVVGDSEETSLDPMVGSTSTLVPSNPASEVSDVIALPNSELTAMFAETTLDNDTILWPSESAHEEADAFLDVPDASVTVTERDVAIDASTASTSADSIVVGMGTMVDDANHFEASQSALSTSACSPAKEVTFGDFAASSLTERPLRCRRKWSCEKCTKNYTSRRRLNCHKKVHFPNSIVCVVCGAVLANDEQRYEAHLERHRRRTSNRRLTILPADVSESFDDSRREARCHVKHMTSTKEKKNVEVVSQESLKELRRSLASSRASGENLVCAECGFTASNRKQLYRHGVKFEHFTQPTKAKSACVLRCELCEYSTEVKFNMLRHVQRRHCIDKAVICEYCGTSFKDSDTMKNHVRYVHENERNVSCNECGKCFVSTWNLHRHQRIRHSGDRPFGCDRCGKMFQTANNTRRHQREHCTLNIV